MGRLICNGIAGWGILSYCSTGTIFSNVKKQHGRNTAFVLSIPTARKSCWLYRYSDQLNDLNMKVNRTYLQVEWPPPSRRSRLIFRIPFECVRIWNQTMAGHIGWRSFGSPELVESSRSRRSESRRNSSSNNNSKKLTEGVGFRVRT